MATHVLDNCCISAQQIIHTVSIFNALLFTMILCIYIIFFFLINPLQVLCKLLEKEFRMFGWQIATICAMVFGQLQIYKGVATKISTVQCRSCCKSISSHRFVFVNKKCMLSFEYVFVIIRVFINH